MNMSELWRVVSVLSLGQLLSFSLAVSSFISSFIANLGANLPFTQAFFSFLPVALVYGAVLLYQRKKLMVSWYWYLMLAIFDLHAAYFVTKSYQYASITSVMLLDCWTIPWVIILTRFALGTRYSPWQYFGVAICVVGLALVLLSDARESGGGILSREIYRKKFRDIGSLDISKRVVMTIELLVGGKDPLLGDALVIAGTFCYAFSNVGQEFLVKKKDQFELLAMTATFGVIVSACEVSIFERKDFESIKWSPMTIYLFIGFSASALLFYTVLPSVMKMSGATLFNLSLLTSDMWAVVIRIFYYHQNVDYLYYLAFCIVAIGLVIYSLNESLPNSAASIADEEVTVRYAQLTDENTIRTNAVLPTDVDALQNVKLEEAEEALCDS